MKDEEKTVSLREWFGLRRENWILDPRNNLEDRKFYASRPNSINIEREITSLEIELEAKLSPKKLYWGVYGSGKTHTLYKVLQELSERLDIQVAFVECPVLKKTSNFTELYNKTTDAMGMEFAITILREKMDRVVQEVGFRNPEIVERRLIETMQDEDLGRATYRFITQQFDPMIIWRWLTASGISPKERNELRVTTDLVDADPARLAAILVTLGRFLYEEHGKSLVLVFDELDRAKNLNPDSEVTFSTALTRLTEPGQTYVSIFLAMSAPRVDQLPTFITEPVRDRIGKENIVEIPAMTSDDVEPFVKDLVQYVRDPKVDVSEKIEIAKRETNEEISEDFYPFTKDALEAIKSACGTMIVPRSICRYMSKSAAYAKIRGKMCVTKKDVESAVGL